MFTGSGSVTPASHPNQLPHRSQGKHHMTIIRQIDKQNIHGLPLFVNYPYGSKGDQSPKTFLSSISKFQQNYRELIRRFLTHVTLMIALANGKRKQKIWQTVSSRTSTSLQETKLAKHWLKQDRNSNYKTFRIIGRFFCAIINPSRNLLGFIYYTKRNTIQSILSLYPVCCYAQTV